MKGEKGLFTELEVDPSGGWFQKMGSRDEIGGSVLLKSEPKLCPLPLWLLLLPLPALELGKGSDRWVEPFKISEIL